MPLRFGSSTPWEISLSRQVRSECHDEGSQGAPGPQHAKRRRAATLLRSVAKHTRFGAFITAMVRAWRRCVRSSGRFRHRGQRKGLMGAAVAAIRVLPSRVKTAAQTVLAKTSKRRISSPVVGSSSLTSPDRRNDPPATANLRPSGDKHKSVIQPSGSRNANRSSNGAPSKP